MRWLPDGWRRPPGRHVRPREHQPWLGVVVPSGLITLVGVGLAVGFALLYASAGVPLPSGPVPSVPPSTVWQPPPPATKQPVTAPPPPEPTAAEPATPSATPAATPLTGVRPVVWSTGKASPTPSNRSAGSAPQPRVVRPGPSPSVPLPDPQPPAPSLVSSDLAPAAAAPSPPSTSTTAPPPFPSGKPGAGPTCPGRDRADGRARHGHDRGRRCWQCGDLDAVNPEHRRPDRPQVPHRQPASDSGPLPSPTTKLSVPPAAADPVAGGSPTPTPDPDGEEPRDA
jgi:hypothetical protein